MGWWVMGTEHLARCICATNAAACPFHQQPVRVVTRRPDPERSAAIERGKRRADPVAIL